LLYRSGLSHSHTSPPDNAIGCAGACAEALAAIVVVVALELVGTVDVAILDEDGALPAR
jgi:hypothetical protein